MQLLSLLSALALLYNEMKAAASSSDLPPVTRRCSKIPMESTTGTTLLSVATPYGIVSSSDTRTSSSGYVVNALSSKVHVFTKSMYDLNVIDKDREESERERERVSGIDFSDGKAFWALMIMRTGVTRGTREAVRIIREGIDKWYRQKYLGELRVNHNPILPTSSRNSSSTSPSLVLPPAPYPTFTVRELVPLLRSSFSSLPANLQLRTSLIISFTHPLDGATLLECKGREGGEVVIIQHEGKVAAGSGGNHVAGYFEECVETTAEAECKKMGLEIEKTAKRNRGASEEEDVPKCTEDELRYITAAAKATLYAIRVDPSSGGIARVVSIANRGRTGIVREILVGPAIDGVGWKVIKSRCAYG